MLRSTRSIFRGRLRRYFSTAKLPAIALEPTDGLDEVPRNGSGQVDLEVIEPTYPPMEEFRIDKNGTPIEWGELYMPSFNGWVVTLDQMAMQATISAPADAVPGNDYSIEIQTMTNGYSGTFTVV